jgi:hypothetical protein
MHKSAQAAEVGEAAETAATARSEDYQEWNIAVFICVGVGKRVEGTSGHMHCFPGMAKQSSQ